MKRTLVTLAMCSALALTGCTGSKEEQPGGAVGGGGPLPSSSVSIPATPTASASTPTATSTPEVSEAPKYGQLGAPKPGDEEGSISVVQKYLQVTKSFDPLLPFPGYDTSIVGDMLTGRMAQDWTVMQKNLKTPRAGVMSDYKTKVNNGTRITFEVLPNSSVVVLPEKDTWLVTAAGSSAIKSSGKHGRTGQTVYTYVVKKVKGEYRIADDHYDHIHE